MPDNKQLKDRIKEIMASHKGQGNPISRLLLGSMTGLEDRQLRELIAEIRQTERIPIISTYKALGGYFWAITAQEIDFGIGKAKKYFVSFNFIFYHNKPIIIPIIKPTQWPKQK